MDEKQSGRKVKVQSILRFDHVTRG